MGVCLPWQFSTLLYYLCLIYLFDLLNKVNKPSLVLLYGRQQMYRGDKKTLYTQARYT